MKRKLILVGNWKMHKTRGETKAFVHELTEQTRDASCHIFIAPPFTALAAAASSAQAGQIVIGAQNMHDAERGAFTGEISVEMLEEAGARFVILGHSERRHIFHETNAFINRKVRRALESRLQPILCIGETAEEREEGETEEVLRNQLEECLQEVSPEGIIIAYEPVWAIGTGKVATPEGAQETHRFCRSWFEKKFGKELANKLPILYGGSVKPDNIAELCAKPDIDGALVGGAALDVNSFVQMVKRLER
jgi:triosephosphate isomerase